jgi:hypothetical protein
VSESAPRVTYATLAAGQSDEFRHRFDAAVDELRAGFGEDHPHLIDGEGVAGEEWFEDRNPADTPVLRARFPVGTPADVYYVPQFLREQSRILAH